MRKQFFNVLRWSVVLLPPFLFLCALPLPQISGAMGLFSDTPGPWYQSVTAPLFLAALFYGYPVTRLCLRLGGDDMFLWPGYYIVLGIYTIAWMLLWRALFLFCERRRRKTV
jgi:hypothetical protein